MRNIVKQIACLMLALTMIIAYAPLELVWAVSRSPEEVTTEGADDASSVIIENNENDVDAGNEAEGDVEIIDGHDEEVADDEAADTDESSEDNDEEKALLNEDKDSALEFAPTDGVQSPALGVDESPDEIIVSVDESIENGMVYMDGLLGTAIPDENFDLATVRQTWIDSDGDTQEKYLEYEYNEIDGSYSFEADPEIGESEITAFFFNLKKWDGAVDLTWYDPDQMVFEISTPAQLAGLAAITNGMVDDNVTDDNKVTTAEYMIKDNAGRTFSNGVYTHKYVSTEEWLVDLLSPNSSTGSSPEASQVRDTAWRLPEVVHNKVAEDDVHNDFLYRTVKLTADLDMSGANWTPIGGKYAMNRDADTGAEAKVIDTRFQGVFDGQGHTVTLDCNRQAKMGFPYAMEIALIGYLGGGVDYDNGYPKDTCMDYKKYWVPTVRNVVVEGEIKGRRMVGGVVGRIGETNHGVVVENCVNHANVEATDMRGCAGIVGAAWGKSIIRNCYNTGTIHSVFWEYGGIVGSNGYEGTGNRVPCGASVYNCYNVGNVERSSGSNQYTYDGQDIGVDGNASASYEIANCYYIEPESVIEGKTGYSVGENNKNKNVRLRDVEGLAPEDMKSEAFVNRMNMNGKVFVYDENNANDGYPILYYQADAQQSGNAEVTLDKEGTTNGSLSFENNENVDTIGDNPFGSIIDLSVKPSAGYRFSKYIVMENNGSDMFEISSGNFVAVTGKNISVRAVFEEVSPTKIIFNEPDDEGVLYYVVVKRVGRLEDDKLVPYDSPIEVRSGDMLEYEECISITGVMKDWGSREPDDNNTEYTGGVSDPYEDPSLKKVANTNNVYSITGISDIATIQFKPKTQGKRWSSIADTSWYTGTSKEYVIKNARQLAGVSRLCLERTTDFEGVTIKLGNDISLANTKENGGNGYEISWFGIGVANTPFRGTFDGQGHTVRYIHRNFATGYCENSAGSYGGLFGVTEDAVIRNVKVEAGTYVNDAGAEMHCGFIHGASGGGIAGGATNTLIENCSTDIPINGNTQDPIGGIVGEIDGSTIIRNCTSNCEITAVGESAGGIAGIVKSSKTRIEKCVNNGDISSTKGKVGGILGNGMSVSATISQCINNGNISTSMKGTSGEAHAMGGISGYSAGALTISQCINKGKLYGYQQTLAMGGVAGTILRGTITDSMNLGDIYSESTSKWAEVSGIANVGDNSTIATIKNSFNAGKITLGEGFTSDAMKNVGGAVGYGDTGTNVFSKVFCTDKSVVAAGGKAGIAGKVVSEEQLKTDPITLLGDNFAPDMTGVNGGYPVLIWQVPQLTGTVTLTGVAKSSDTALTVSWKKTGAGDGVELHRSLKKDSGFAKVYSGNAASFNNSKLAYGKTYYYKARVYRTIDGKTYYSGWSAVKSFSLIPPAAKFSSVKNTKGKKVTLKWKKVSGVTGYEIYRSTRKNSGFKKIATIKKAKTVKYIDKKKLKKGKTYYYKIKTYKTVSKNKGYSADSAVKKVKIKK